MSSFLIFGIFKLTDGRRELSEDASDSSIFTSTRYSSVLRCCSGNTLPTTIRYQHHQLLDDHSVVLTMAKAYVSCTGHVMLDAYLLSICSNMDDEDRPSHFRFPLIIAIGNMLPYHVSSMTLRAFLLCVEEKMWHGIRSSTLWSVHHTYLIKRVLTITIGQLYL